MDFILSTQMSTSSLSSRSSELTTRNLWISSPTWNSREKIVSEGTKYRDWLHEGESELDTLRGAGGSTVRYMSRHHIWRLRTGSVPTHSRPPHNPPPIPSKVVPSILFARVALSDIAQLNPTLTCAPWVEVLGHSKSLICLVHENPSQVGTLVMLCWINKYFFQGVWLWPSYFQTLSSEMAR